MDIVTYALCNKKMGSKASAIVDTTAASSSVVVNADAANKNAIQSVVLYGETYQNGTATPDAPVEITPLEGYDTMTGTGENASYSRSASFDPAADQYYAIQIESGTDTVWVGTADKIRPLYDGDTIDFVTGIVTRNNDTETLAIADMNNVTEAYPGWMDDWEKYNGTGVNKEMLATDGNYSSIGSENGRVCRISSDGDVLYRPYGSLNNRTQSEWIELYPDLVINFVLKLSETVTEKVELNRSMSGFVGELTITSTGSLTAQFVFDTKTYVDGHSGGTPAVNSVNGKIGNVIIDTADLMRNSDEQHSDFDISDVNGNVILRLANGNLQTKYFDSKYYQSPVEEYFAYSTYTAGATNTLVISHSFSKGDKIYYHLSDNQHYYDYGKYASYYEGSKLIASNRRGSNGYFEHIISEDVDSVSISIGGDQYSNGQPLRLYVYKINGEIKPKVVTVATDGSGMYTTLKEAVESITNANSITNPYVIEVYPGIYDTLEGYTDEEIASADIGGGYSQTSFVGLKITDGISLRGVGNADEVVLTAELSTDDWSSAVRGNISTLNIQGSSTVENLTITAYNLRYCIHDDFNSPINTHEKRVLKNLYLYGSNVAYAPYGSAYGAGMTVPRDYIVENCEFNYGFGIHSSSGHTFGCNIIMDNCSAHRAYFSDVANSLNDAVHNIYIHNCNFDRIELSHTESDVGQHMMLHGVGNELSIIKTAPSDLYEYGAVTKHPTNLGTGTLVSKNSSGDSIVVADNIAVAYGVVIGNDGVNDYVQRSGYIASNRFELSDLAVGDYVTIDENSKIVAGGTVANAVGIVTAVDADDVAFIKLLI